MIEELRRFILVTKSGNVSKTAENIFITQSALSQSLKRLEKELGTKLFIQKGKALHLSSQGKAISEIGTKILELWERAKDPMIKQLTLPSYAVGLFDSGALRLGKYFIRTKKEFTLDLTIDSSSKLLSLLQLGTLDLAVCVINKNDSTPKSLILVKSFKENLIPVTLHPFKGPIDKIPFIIYNKESITRLQLDEQFKQHGLIPNILVESTSVSFMKELAALGTGVALLPETYLVNDIKQGVLKKQKLPMKFEREFGLYIQKNGKLQIDDLVIRDLIRNLG